LLGKQEEEEEKRDYTYRGQKLTGFILMKFCANTENKLMCFGSGPV